jgi:hypothetical protein
MPDHPIIDDDIRHTHAVQRSLVIRLSASGWIERGAVQNYRRPASNGLSPNDARRELTLIWVLDVKTFC